MRYRKSHDGISRLITNDAKIKSYGRNILMRKKNEIIPKVKDWNDKIF